MVQSPEIVALPPDEREQAPPAAASIENPVYVPSPKFTERELSHGELQLQEFLKKVQLANQPPPPPPPPPEMTQRQRTQIELEMEAGRKAVARHTAQQAHRPQPKPDPTEGKTTPVFRPEDYIPNLNSKSDEQRGYRQL